jgi:hypothetical protein
MMVAEQSKRGRDVPKFLLGELGPCSLTLAGWIAALGESVRPALVYAVLTRTFAMAEKLDPLADFEGVSDKAIVAAAFLLGANMEDAKIDCTCSATHANSNMQALDRLTYHMANQLAKQVL